MSLCDHEMSLVEFAERFAAKHYLSVDDFQIEIIGDGLIINTLNRAQFDEVCKMKDEIRDVLANKKAAEEMLIQFKTFNHHNNFMAMIHGNYLITHMPMNQFKDFLKLVMKNISHNPEDNVQKDFIHQSHFTKLPEYKTD